jgi:hypothetical protein
MNGGELWSLYRYSQISDETERIYKNGIDKLVEIPDSGQSCELI